MINDQILKLVAAHANHNDIEFNETVKSIALLSELNLPLYRQQTDELIDGILGGTAANLRTVFRIIHNHLGIYLFDEFDSIATQRQVSQNSADSADNEMRRVLNSLLQFIENDNSQSFIIATTNMKSILDLALFRRFDVVLHYLLPEQKLRKLMFQRQLEKYKVNVPIKM